MKTAVTQIVKPADKNFRARIGIQVNTQLTIIIDKLIVSKAHDQSKHGRSTETCWPYLGRGYTG